MDTPQEMDNPESVSKMDASNIFNEMEVEDPNIYTGEAKPEFVYENLTLDEIIQLKRAEDPNYARLTGGGIRYGTDDTRVGSILPTPIFVLKCLADDGKLIEMEAKELTRAAAVNTITDFRAHRWRVTWTHEDVQGISEAPRKMMAKQVAALDLVEKLRKRFPNYDMQDCEVPAGAVINPYLFTLLENTCVRMGYGPPEYHLQINSGKGRKFYASICYIHDEIFIGKSFDEMYAKRFAAKRAYESLIGMPYPGDEIVKGDQCSQNPDQYHAVESEATHVYYLYKKQRSLSRASHSGVSSPGMSRSSSLTSLSETGGVTKNRPPRLRPPPISMSKELRLAVEEAKRLEQIKANAPKPAPLVPPWNGFDEYVEIEDPFKYEGLDDDDEEIAEILAGFMSLEAAPPSSSSP